MRWLIGTALLLVVSGALLYPRLEQRRAELAMEQWLLDLEALLPAGAPPAPPEPEPVELAWRSDLEAVLAAIDRKPLAEVPLELAELERLLLDPVGIAALERSPLWPSATLLSVSLLSRVLLEQAGTAMGDGRQERAMELIGRSLDASQGLDRPDLIGLLLRGDAQGKALDFLDEELHRLDPTLVLTVLEERLEAALRDGDWRDAVEYEARASLRMAQGFEQPRPVEDTLQLSFVLEMWVHALAGTAPAPGAEPRIEGSLGNIRSTEPTDAALRARIRKLLQDLRAR